jgi:predicted membrane protein
MTWTRAPLLIVALAISGVLLLYPYVLGTTMGPAEHAALPLTMLGVSGAFVHSVGYTPTNRALRILFGPTVASSLMLAGIALLVLSRMNP